MKRCDVDRFCLLDTKDRFCLLDTKDRFCLLDTEDRFCQPDTKDRFPKCLPNFLHSWKVSPNIFKVCDYEVT